MSNPALFKFVNIKITFRETLLLFIFSFILGFLVLNHTEIKNPVTKAQAQSCPNVPAEIIFMIDKSGSMDDPATKYVAAKRESINFINRIANVVTDPITYVGAVSFANTPPPVVNPDPITKLEWRLTRFYSNVTNAINNIETPGGGTCFACGIIIANDQFATYKTPDRKNVVIIISDGEATRKLDGTLDKSDAVGEALAEVQKMVDQHQVTFYTISVDPLISNYDIRFMQNMANMSGGKYYQADENTIDDALNDIFTRFGKGSITGYKYNDVDKDGNFDSSESGLSGWRIELRNQQGTQVRTPATTNTDGMYRFDNLCEGTYVSSEQRQAEWDITEPIGNSRTMTVSNGTSLINQNFGNVKYPAVYNISGNVFMDNNPKNDKLDTGESNYTGQITLSYTLSGTPTKTITTNSNYTLSNLVQGNYVVELSYISPYNHYPLNRRFSVVIGPSCTPGISNDASCVNGNVVNLNFGLSTTDLWTQTTGLDVRWDDGWINHIPNNASCSSNASINASSNTPGVIVSGDQNSEFLPGKASVKEWIAGNTVYSEKYIRSTRLQTSYSSMYSTIQKSGTSIIPINHPTLGIPTCIDQNSCTLIGETNGAFSVEGNLKILSGEINADNAKTVILVNGSVEIMGEIHVKKGNFLMIVASGEINVAKNVGNSTPSCLSSVIPDVEGIYVSNSNFTADGDDNCLSGPDNMLTMAGTIVVNAGRNGGSFNNKRSLCEANINFPSVKVRERPDFVLNAPPYIQSQSTIWKEVAP